MLSVHSLCTRALIGVQFHSTRINVVHQTLTRTMAANFLQESRIVFTRTLTLIDAVFTRALTLMKMQIAAKFICLLDLHLQPEVRTLR